MTPELIKQFSVQLENKPGRLAQALSALAHEKLNITAATIAAHHDRSVLRLVTDDMKATQKALRKLNMPFTEDEVLLTPMRNRPGALAEVCEKLAAEHINIDYAYSSAASVNGKSLGIFKVANAAKALKLLAEEAAPKRNGFAKMGRKGRNAKTGKDEE